MEPFFYAKPACSLASDKKDALFQYIIVPELIARQGRRASQTFTFWPFGFYARLSIMVRREG
ncbi:hypothetical protein KSD_05550 [Ktedonobacter sp. SOSP1-85]|uniref:Uncharacterized protein n=1 Tax=Ktedonobacter robiniae TaxID=2778365 RepID=A0ABQ3USL8_9CHLR|nr:hypothetical protein KSB_41250 [Ktedonobacter robiniae]GHO72784.1 hypothetical protein KSD_05550 [Ktedonobacter sp. SOSP1-85]